MTDSVPSSDALPGEPANSGGAHTEPAESHAPSLLAYPATYLLVGINVLVFLVMCVHSPVLALFRQHAWHTASGQLDLGAASEAIWHALNAPFDTELIYQFGGSASASVLQGQWWRLLTSTFVHVTILHLLVNMWCLWNLGFFGEPLLGRPGLIAVYVITGVAGMMLSLAASVFTRQPDMVAGASGAVFGIAGILIILLSNRGLSLPWEELRSLRRSVVLFAVLNLAIGALPRLLAMLPELWLRQVHVDAGSLPQVDNMAHLGGFISGLALGLPLFPRMTQGKVVYRARQRLVFGVAALLLCILGYYVHVVAITHAG